MRQLIKNSTALIGALVLVLASFQTASAACKKMGFLVNDYGKEGPTKDAQLLLDKHIAAWADEQGIDEYTVGKKSVKCELYLDLIVFDEHTCTASATVCWGGSKQPRTETAKAKKKSKSTTASAGEKSDKDKASSKTAATKQAEPKKPAKPVVTTVSTKKETVAPSKEKVETSAIVRDAPSAKPAASPSVPYAKDAVIRSESGASESKSPPAAATAAVTPSPSTSDVGKERAAADRAAAAAERAAAAAERAAAAAQLAAEAAKKAAATSAAVSAPAKSSAVVEPVTPSLSP